MALLCRTSRLWGATAQASALSAAGALRLKSTTGIVGLAVEPNAKPVLVGLYNDTLAALESVPAGAEYRVTVEAQTKQRLAVVMGGDDLEKIEATIGAGQVEQLIMSARDELALIPRLVAANAFSPYDGSTSPEEIFNDLKQRGIALQRDDIPMRPTVNFPTEAEVELQLPAPPEAKS